MSIFVPQRSFIGQKVKGQILIFFNYLAQNQPNTAHISFNITPIALNLHLH